MELIPIDKELDSFKSHLDINERTIFSAKFGDGKTFFLNKFKKKYKENYEFITIYPVNYQVSDNKAIFEYIKRDILIQMVAKRMIKPSYEIPDSLIFQFFIMQKSQSFLGNLLQILPYLGVSEETVSHFLTGYSMLNWSTKMSKKYQEYNKIILKQDENAIIETFVNSFSDTSGSPYEIDLISKIIIDNIQWFRHENTNKKIVLIIEDLDRIDPAHLFRILNIFSAHIDRVYQYSSDNYQNDSNNVFPELLSNKFGFDNIITVFDYNKTKHIFHHFYGLEANYHGYINKFSSHQPFYYSIDELAKKYLYQVLSKECCIREKELVEIIQQINKANNILSVRDVCSILNGLDLYTIEKTYITHSGINFSTKSPLAYTITLFKLLGITDISKVKMYINKLPTLDFLNCINVYLLIFPIHGLAFFKFNGKTYKIINKEHKGGILKKVEIQEIRIFGDPPVLEINFEECFNEALNYVIK